MFQSLKPERITVGMKFFDLFCGAGGLSYGFLRAGFNPLGGFDRDEDAAKTYKRVFRIVFKRDAFSTGIKELRTMVGEADVLLSCPPCQGFTQIRAAAGLREDRRNSLVDYLAELVRVTKPKALVFENVPPVRRYKGFSRLLRILAGGGYAYAYGVLDAADYGVPQRRRRLILIAVRGAGKIALPEPDHGPPTHPEVILGRRLPWRTVRDAIGDLPPVEAGECHPRDPLHCAKALPPNHLELIRRIPKDGGTRFDVPPDYWLPVHRRRPNSFKTTFSRLRWDEPSNTITTKFFDPSTGPFVHPEQDRGLTLREGARLQTFPDDYPFYGSFRKIAKQIGEAFPPLFAEKIARHLRQVV
jgi:DNA (cytosine-5)-methyltransferase 1